MITAISHSWGRRVIGSEYISRFHRRFPITNACSCGNGKRKHGIEQLLTACEKTVKTRYIWIDWIALNQQDVEDQGKKIGLQHIVFKKAGKCLLFIYDMCMIKQRDYSSALCGLIPIGETNMLSISATENMKAAQVLLNLLRKTLWSSSAWCMQEWWLRQDITRIWWQWS